MANIRLSSKLSKIGRLGEPASDEKWSNCASLENDTRDQFNDLLLRSSDVFSFREVYQLAKLFWV